MDVETITMDQDVARAKLAEYREGVQQRVDASLRRQWDAMATAYATLAKGTPLLNLHTVLRDAPRDDENRPRLAVARADRQEVYFYQRGRRMVFQSGGYRMFDPPEGTLVVGLQSHPRDDLWASGWAKLPMIPPHALRSAKEKCGTRDRKRLFVLWEVDEWANRSHFAKPSKDPFLLYPVGGLELFAVVAMWDLTPLEMAVLETLTDG